MGARYKDKRAGRYGLGAFPPGCIRKASEREAGRMGFEGGYRPEKKRRSLPALRQGLALRQILPI